MTDKIIYAGEDFYMMINFLSSDDDPQDVDLSDFDVTAQLSVNLMGSKICASTIDANALEIERLSDGSLMVHIPSEYSKTLSEGELMLSLIFIHKTTGEKTICEMKTLEVKQPKISIQ